MCDDTIEPRQWDTPVVGREKEKKISNFSPGNKSSFKVARIAIVKGLRPRDRSISQDNIPEMRNKENKAGLYESLTPE